MIYLFTFNTQYFSKLYYQSLFAYILHDLVVFQKFEVILFGIYTNFKLIPLGLQYLLSTREAEFKLVSLLGHANVYPELSTYSSSR